MSLKSDDIEDFSFAGRRLVRFFLPEFSEVITGLLDEMHRVSSEFTYSHKINGRWENSYLPIGKVPSVRKVVHFSRNVAVEKFGKSLLATFDMQKGVRLMPFWFNIARPGESTGVHNHSSQASVSGVFYLRTTEDSGNIFFRVPDHNDLELDCFEGSAILFPSSLSHGVHMNLSDKDRISLAFNLLKFPLPIDDDS